MAAEGVENVSNKMTHIANEISAVSVSPEQINLTSQSIGA